jgi:DNA-binding LytR/AlgR family response regulator
MRALVVDDEAPARSRMRRLLAELGGVDVVGEAHDGASALTAILALQPDVVLLDIRMPGIDGLTLAQTCRALPPIIFCTGYDEHAVKAFEVNAVDYLLKPVRPERLAAALARVRVAPANSGPAAQTLALTALAPPNATRVITSSRGEVKFFEAQHITRFWAAEKYTLFVADDEEQLTEEPLAALETRLAPLGFVRVHRSEVVQLRAVKALRDTDGIAEVTLSDGQVARVSRRLLHSVRKSLQAMGGR